MKTWIKQEYRLFKTIIYATENTSGYTRYCIVRLKQLPQKLWINFKISLLYMIANHSNIVTMFLGGLFVEYCFTDEECHQIRNVLKNN